MKLIGTRDAVGHILCHDLTRIEPGVMKGVAFQKGHIITEEDIPLLLSMGKENLYIWEKDENMLHENEAAQILCGMCQNDSISASSVKEGKIELTADIDGLFLVDVKRLHTINAFDDIVIATRHTYTAVRKGDKLAGMRVVPLVIEKEKMERVKMEAGDLPLLKLLPFVKKKAAIIATGNEILHGRIEDQFTPVVIKKLNAYGVGLTSCVKTEDNKKMIVSAILDARNTGAELIICTGGMSVDPDDQTPGAIKASGAQIVTYGAPVLPGAMFLLGYFEDGVSIMGLPGCVMYAKTTIFDLILPRIIAGQPVTKTELTVMGHGGLCLNCAECRQPQCAFGRGG